MRSIYYAAPFFNPREMEVMDKVRALAETRSEHLKVFYPYYASEGLQSSIQDPASRRRVYLANEQALIHNTELLAWVDRLQMDGKQVQMCEQRTYIQGEWSTYNAWFGNGRELKQPDLGTVWEMGFARGRGKVVVAFTLQDPVTAKLNLMMTESVDLVLYGWEQLMNYFNQATPYAVNQFIQQQRTYWKGQVE